MEKVNRLSLWHIYFGDEACLFAVSSLLNPSQRPSRQSELTSHEALSVFVDKAGQMSRLNRQKQRKPPNLPAEQRALIT